MYVRMYTLLQGSMTIVALVCIIMILYVLLYKILFVECAAYHSHTVARVLDPTKVPQSLELSMNRATVVYIDNQWNVKTQIHVVTLYYYQLAIV